MKKIFKLLSLVFAAGMLFSSCDQKEEIKFADNPLKSVSVAIGDESAVGIVNDTDKTILFVFDSCETFSNADITVEVNEGWTLTFPTTLTGVNLEETPVLNFEDPSGQRVRYTISFSSNAFPVVDASKIQIRGFEPGEHVTLDNTTKVISVVYNQETMNYNSVELIFNEGALQAGVVAPEDLEFDFTDGIEQPIVFNLDGERVYTLKLDVSAYQKKSLSEMSFQDVTADFVNPEEYPYINVYKSTQMSGVPVFWLNSVWQPSNPRNWEHWDGYVEGEPYPYVADVFSMPGNWDENRPTKNCWGTLAIVTIDQAKVKGEIIPNEDYSKTFGEIPGLVTLMGCKKGGGIDYLTYNDGAIANNPAFMVPWRNSIGFSEDGKLSYAVAALKGSEFYQVPFQKDWMPLGADNWSADAAAVQAVADAATEKWNVSDAAWAYGWLIRDGKALSIQDIIKNDATNYVSDAGVLGMGWASFYMKRLLVGRTYDNKIAILVTAGGQDYWDSGYDTHLSGYDVYDNEWGYFFGYGTNQLAWIASQLGWRDLALVSTSDDEGDTSIEPNVRINGKAVISMEEAHYNPPTYANDSAEKVASYYISLTAK